jgi:hypothetical protein
MAKKTSKDTLSYKRVNAILSRALKRSSASSGKITSFTSLSGGLCSGYNPVHEYGIGSPGVQRDGKLKSHFL